MDKQKQIEEMAKDMLEYALEYYPKDMSVFTETKLREQFYLLYLGYAQYLIKAGYRKIPENAVVLTREEYDELQIGKDFNYGVHSGESNMTAYYENIRLPEVRKETAEKIADWLDNEKGYCGLGYLIKQRFCAEEKEK